MQNIRDLLTKEPNLLIGLVLAAIGVAGAFGLALTEEQTAAIVAFVGAGLALAGFLLGRGKVYSPETHYRQLQETHRGAFERGRRQVPREPSAPHGEAADPPARAENTL